ncbi:MAG: TonB-dependent receptor [Acidobacteriaceae bacterium]|nr:TonB-dependent receptor [Acidobacteriaceae bacterium]
MRATLCALWMTCLLWPATAVAQERRATITGLVTDPSKAILQAASVELEPIGTRTVTDNTGQFSMKDLPAGTYTLTISFVGMADYTRQITVTAGETARLELEMQIASPRESVTVTSEEIHGEAEAINRERAADNIVQVLPSDIITSLPNANVADAIGRLPSVTLERDEGEGKYVQIRGTEPRYSNVTIDGVNVPSPEGGVRQIKLDTIGSDLVESVEINKTLLANMDGDGIGGSVNLRTKTAGEDPIISLYGIGGITPIQNTRYADQFGGTVSKRFGKEKRLGILFGGSYDWNGRGIDDVEPSPEVIQCDPGNCLTPSATAANFGTYNTEDIRLYTYYRTRYGFTGTVDYKLDSATIYIRGLYSHFDNFGDRWVLTPIINSFTTSPTQGGPDGSMSYNASIRRPIDVIGSLEAGGTYSFGSSYLNWSISVSRSAEDQHGYSGANFAPISNSPLNAVQFALDRSDPYRPKFIVQNGVNLYDTTQYQLQNFDIDHSYSPQLNLQAGADYFKPYNWGGHSGVLAIGGKIRNAHKFSENDDIVYNLNDPSVAPLSMFPIKETVTNYYNGSYKAPPAINYNTLLNFYHANTGDFSVDPTQTLVDNAGGNYNLVERVGAGYIMNTISLGRFRLITGIRFETTTEDVAGNILAQDDQGNFLGLSRVTKKFTYVDPLPSGELRIGLTSNSAIRLCYGRGLARPQFGDLAPDLSLTISSQTGGRNTSSIGNPNLKATHADNYDVLFEQYLKPLGLVTAGFFYKNIRDPIVTIQTQNVMYPGFPESFLQDQPDNIGSAYVWGWEAAYEQHWAFLPGLMSGLGFSGNYSYTSSRTDGIPGRSDHPPLLRQAPNTWNLGPTYDRGRLSVRMGLSYNAANIYAYQYQDGAPLGLKGPNGDNYLYAHLQVDAQGSYRLPKGFKLIVYGLNLTNEVFGFYNGSGVWPVQREYYNRTFGTGIRWSSAER